MRIGFVAPVNTAEPQNPAEAQMVARQLPLRFCGPSAFLRCLP